MSVTRSGGGRSADSVSSGTSGVASKLTARSKRLRRCSRSSARWSSGEQIVTDASTCSVSANGDAASASRRGSHGDSARAPSIRSVGMTTSKTPRSDASGTLVAIARGSSGLSARAVRADAIACATYASVWLPLVALSRCLYTTQSRPTGALALLPAARAIAASSGDGRPPSRRSSQALTMSPTWGKR
eukprot:4664482-Prymnesium_polylepis.1